MAEFATPRAHLSIEQYLELERNSPIRHDFVAGQCHPIAETSERHDQIVANIYHKLVQAAEDMPCRVSMNTAKLRAPNGSVYYPDVVVVCEPERGDSELEHEPCLLVEVVSPETEAIDHREKWGAYNKIPSLKTYLIIEQDSPRVDRSFRLESGKWFRAVDVDLENGVFYVPCPYTMNLFLSQIYAGL